MTSGVKQALPPVLAPKTGAEGKAVRNRMPQADFAEALGIGNFRSSPTRATPRPTARTSRQNPYGSGWRKNSRPQPVVRRRSPQNRRP